MASPSSPVSASRSHAPPPARNDDSRALAQIPLQTSASLIPNANETCRSNANLLISKNEPYLWVQRPDKLRHQTEGEVHDLLSGRARRSHKLVHSASKSGLVACRLELPGHT